MTRSSFWFFLTLAVATGCSSSAEPADDTGAADSEIQAAPKPSCEPEPPPPPPPATQCEAKGGTCVGLSPAACEEGFFADASTHACGGGIGVGCCIACPVLSPPAPGFCPDGVVEPRTDESGCVRGFDCKPAPATACEAKGGACVALTPSSCQNGTWADATTHPCGGGLGVGCCIE